MQCGLLQTACGPVRGILDGGLCAFLGIPYASAERWRLPKLVTPTNGNCWSVPVLNASKYGPACPQRGTGQQWYNTTQREACLTLNVWLPPATFAAASRANATGRVPIFAFLHGGSSIVGAAANPLNHPAALAKAGFVAINLNYRIGALGYLAMPAPHLPGMLGVQDAIAALRWLHENAAALGGDAKRLTVWGQSTGGTMVQSLLFAPSARGLFAAAVSMSGSPRMNDTFATAAGPTDTAFIRRSNCTLACDPPGRPHDAPRCERCLRAMSPAQLIEASPLRVYPWWDPWGAKGVPMSFTDLPSGAEAATPPASLLFADGATVPFAPDESFARGSYVDVPLVIGSAAQEIDFGPKEKGLTNLTEAEYASFVARKFADFPDVAPSDVLRLYPLSHFVDAQHAYESMASDVRVNCGILSLARRYAQAFKSPVYSYVNEHRLSTPIALFKLYGNDWVQRFSSHQLDQILLLKTYNNPVSGEHAYAPSADDERVSAFLLSAFTQLGTKGRLDPSSWPPALGDDPTGPLRSLSLTAQPKVSTEPRAAKCAFWAKHGFGRLAWNN